MTAAFELLERTGIKPIVTELDNVVGGISRTCVHYGNRIDIGGHRFFSKSPKVNEFWERFMPGQTSPALDELLLGAQATGLQTADPEKADAVMLTRRRISRIYYLRRFFDYPVALKWATLRNMGLGNTLKVGFGYLASLVSKKPETSLENFYINRFGRPLYEMFFEDYTRKVWGIHPSELGADWGSQRVKGLSISAVLKDMLVKALGIKTAKKETSLIEEFKYPKLGPGQLWEQVAAYVETHGGEVKMETRVVEVHIGGDNNVDYVVVGRPDGTLEKIACDYFFSSMPLKELVASFTGIEVPRDVKEIAATLRYRDFITVGLLVDKLKVSNDTALKTFGNRIADTWIYVQDRDVKMGRIQVFNNWSPYLVADFKNKVWIGLEYFCDEGDEMWEMDDASFTAMAIGELEKLGIIDADDVADSVRIKIRKAYPTYHGNYYQLDKVREFLDTIGNLYCIGRNGQHRYNNMDHSMLTAMEAVETIRKGKTDKSRVWNVNTEKDYHESK